MASKGPVAATASLDGQGNRTSTFSGLIVYYVGEFCHTGLIRSYAHSNY